MVVDDRCEYEKLTIAIADPVARTRIEICRPSAPRPPGGVVSETNRLSPIQEHVYHVDLALEADRVSGAPACSLLRCAVVFRCFPSLANSGPPENEEIRPHPPPEVSMVMMDDRHHTC